MCACTRYTFLFSIFLVYLLQAKEIETLHTEDLSRWKELKDELARGKEEVDRMKNQQDELMKELQMVQDQRSVLENQIAESDSSAKELEEKIISAVGLLISLRQKRDELRIEHRNAIKEINKLGGSVQEEAAGFCMPQFMSFSFMEINEATNNFDPSWKIGEGSHGSVYKGVLRHMHVAIKMLPFYGSQDHLQFQHEVNMIMKSLHNIIYTTHILSVSSFQTIHSGGLKAENCNDGFTRDHKANC